MQIYFTIAAIATTVFLLFDAVGAIASRKMNFNYSWLSFISFPLYMILGYIGAAYINTSSGISLAALVSLFEAVLGWKIALKLNANFGDLAEMLEEELSDPDIGLGNVIFVMVIGMIAGGLGTLFL